MTELCVLSWDRERATLLTEGPGRGQGGGLVLSPPPLPPGPGETGGGVGQAAVPVLSGGSELTHVPLWAR